MQGELFGFYGGCMLSLEGERGGGKLAKKKNEEGPDQVAGFLFEVMEGRPTERDQLKAAELLGKYLGMFEKKEALPTDKPIEIVGAEYLED